MANTPTPGDVYRGLLVCDGSGNLLADEGDFKGFPVALHEGKFIFIGKDEPSHNERHHKQFVGMVGTQDVDPSLPGYAGTLEKPVKGHEHHFAAPQPSSQLPDAVARTATGHTDAWGDE